MWLQYTVPNATWVNLLDPSTFTSMSADPGRLREIVMAAAGADVVIDEVQREPRLLDVVHQLISESIDRRFILTGSSARSLRCKGTNLLGRSGHQPIPLSGLILPGHRTQPEQCCRRM